MTAPVHGPDVNVHQLFEPTLCKTSKWLSDIRSACDFRDLHQAYTFFRAVLFTARDWCTFDDNITISDHLPMLLRGLYFEGYKLSERRDEVRTTGDFYLSVKHHLGTNPGQLADNIELNTLNSLKVIQAHFPPGDFKRVMDAVPEDMRTLIDLATLHGQTASSSV